jgi:cystathionine beta-lyase/cystathionine gamma-synthase
VIVHSGRLRRHRNLIGRILGRFGVLARFPAAQRRDEAVMTAPRQGRVPLVYLESPANPPTS